MEVKIKEFIESVRSEKKEEACGFLVQLGFKEPEKSLANISILINCGSFNETKEQLIAEAIASPDPDMALNNLERFISALPEGFNKKGLFEKDNLKAVCTLFGGSSFLTNIVIRRPGLLEWLIVQENLSVSSSLGEKTDELRKKLCAVDSMVSLQETLRLFKAREYLRIGLRDLMGLATLVEVMAEISDLASACLQGAYEASSSMLEKEYGIPLYIDEEDVEKEADFVILGMGKFGGRELNFSSDIDLIFLYRSDKGETSGIKDHSNKISLHEYFIRLGKMIIKAMNEVTKEGFVFRVDMDLRPEGQSGDLACSLRSAEIYYESWGQTWERSAMLKARPVAGSISLGEEFLGTIRPFMYRKFLDFTTIEEIRAMKNKIDASIARDDQLLTNLKLGTGGIREIEFFIQALQLINAGKVEALRERNSINALKKLQAAKLISDEEEEKLREAYTFLRNVEHRIQIFQERQTHTLPGDKRELGKLAARVGYRNNPLEEFMRDHQRHTKNVKEIYSSLFHEAADKLKEKKSPEIIALLEGVLSDEEAMEKLLSYGFKDALSALKNLSLLWNGPPFAHFTEKSRAVLRRVAPLIFEEIIASPEPDMALNTFERFISAVGARASFYSLLAENHHVIKFLVGLFGTSGFLSKILLSHPETLDSFVSLGASAPVKTKEEIRDELMEIVTPDLHFEDKLDLMRRFRNVEILRIGMNDIYGEIGLKEVSTQLSALADASLELASLIALEKMKEKYGIPMTGKDGKEQEARMVTIGMGKLGGEEMAYSSDLDIIFIYSGNGETSGEYEGKKDLKMISNQDFFARVGQQIISILTIPTREGYLFKVDMRLRPSGSSGTLVASLDSFAEYHKKSSQTWERQALTRARLTSGDEEFGSKVISVIEDAVYKNGASAQVGAEIARVRARMEIELAKEKDGIYNVKTGKGGIVDIEFLVQFLLLKYGGARPEIRTPNTLHALDRIKDAEILSGKEHRVLSETYVFLRTIENGLRIVHDQSVNRLDTNSKDFTMLARRLSYDSSELLTEYKLRTLRTRNVYSRYLS
ncbi:MAG: bifunctional [glutamate--ammonia ligase]-adenylyl-L-tyrosine phosphorylase/[glutamate--ammonia-ligase] adenylyltransferase [bacterium]|nr:bifunctional [glutamate--ammonia ligase]-adenylyl-L-tyrosine phosphorylase/[glutamate--ammonia-ligase] adenylyltransferase [bacterium]